MKNKKNVIAIAASSFLLVIALFGYVSVRAYISSKKVEQDHQKTVRLLKKDISILTSRLDALYTKMEAFEGRTPPASHRRPRPGGSQGNREDAKGKELKRIGEIIESTGLEQLAALGQVDPDFLQEIYDDYTAQKQIDTYQKKLKEQYNEQNESDRNQYDGEMFSLYERARYRRREPPGNEEKDNAFDELLSKYPDAYATGMAIAQRAFVSSFRGDTQEVEKYYGMLAYSNNDKFLNVVTDHGIEALPNIEYILVQNYLKEGQDDKAEQFMDSLEKNYPDSRILSRIPGKGRQLVPVPDILNDLRQQK